MGSIATTMKRRNQRRVARLIPGCVATLLIWACGPVYIPVPPPEMETSFTADQITDSAGTQHQVWIAAGSPNEHARNARFYLFNQRTNSGVVTTALDDGRYQAPPLEGMELDQVLIYFQDTKGALSGTACVLLSEQRPFAAPCVRP
jgi:hypothetical protein